MPRPRPTSISPVAQDYLKAVWAAGEWSAAPVTTKHLAERLGVGASTVSETVRRLCDQGLLTHVPYGAVELTAAGRAHAVTVVRRHRLLETFLVRELGYGWDEVHDEAEVLEHAVSDRLVERLDQRLGRPARDPHGDPIPTADGVLVVPPARPMSDLPDGRWLVARISDADAALLRRFASLGLVVDAALELVDGGPADDSAAPDVRGPTVGPQARTVRLDGRTVRLDAAAAAAVWLVGPA